MCNSVTDVHVMECPLTICFVGHVPQQTPSSSVYVPDVRGRLNTAHLWVCNYVVHVFSYSPFGGNFVAPVDPAGLASGSMVRKSTSEMYKSQTDWLRTFQQEMSTYARPKLKTTPLKVANKNMSDNLYPFYTQHSLRLCVYVVLIWYAI